MRIEDASNFKLSEDFHRGARNMLMQDFLFLNWFKFYKYFGSKNSIKLSGEIK